MADGIKDKVAILGMGCSKFGERWESGAEDLAAEALVETVAALAARTVARGERVALVTNDVPVDPGSGQGQLERIHEALARARFRPDAPELKAPATAFHVSVQ